MPTNFASLSKDINKKVLDLAFKEVYSKNFCDVENEISKNDIN